MLNTLDTSRKTAYNLFSEKRKMIEVNFLKRVPLFTDVGEADLDALAAAFVRRHFRANETIFQEGDPGQMLYLIETGQVRIYVQGGDDGQEASVVIYGPTDIFGELAVIDGLPRSASAVAMEDTTVYTLTRELFREHMKRTPQLALNFMRALSVRVRYNTQQVGSLTLFDVPARLARKLVELAQQYGVVESVGVRINLSLNQTDLASLTGTTRESINKALGTFKRQGLIAMPTQGQIIIVDADTLREISS
jgi:CRP-like cAMP-binding protein